MIWKKMLGELEEIWRENFVRQRKKIKNFLRVKIYKKSFPWKKSFKTKNFLQKIIEKISKRCSVKEKNLRKKFSHVKNVKKKLGKNKNYQKHFFEKNNLKENFQYEEKETRRENFVQKKSSTNKNLQKKSFSWKKNNFQRIISEKWLRKNFSIKKNPKSTKCHFLRQISDLQINKLLRNVRKNWPFIRNYAPKMDKINKKVHFRPKYGNWAHLPGNFMIRKSNINMRTFYGQKMQYFYSP